MCQMCGYKRDMRVMQATLELLQTVDFESFFVMHDLVISMIYTIDSKEDLNDVEHLLEVPEDCDMPTVVAARSFLPVAVGLEATLELLHSAADTTFEVLKGALEGIATQEEDKLADPPTAFTDFFTKGGNDDE